MSWIQTYDAVFFISLATIIVGAFGMSAKYCLKSKCEHFSLCCGLIKVDRRVDLEIQEEIRAMELGVKDDDEKKEEKDNKV
jgi:hypothetical protein